MPKITQVSAQLSFFGDLDNTPLDSRVVLLDDPRFEELLVKTSQAKIITLDIETMIDPALGGNGLDWSRGKPRLIQTYVPGEDIVLVVDTLSKNPLLKQFLKVLGRQLSNPSCRIVGHNLYFDLCFLKHHYGFRANGIRDTRILSTMLWCGIKYYRHSLAEVYKRLFNAEMSKEMQKSNWNDIKLANTQLNYAAIDVINTYRCFIELAKRLKAFDSMPSIMGGKCDHSLVDIATAECESTSAFVEITTNGLPVNLEEGYAAIKKYEEAIKDLYAPIKKELKLPFTASSTNLCVRIYQEYGVFLLEEKTSKELADMDSDDADEDDVDLKGFGELLGIQALPEIPKTHKLSTSSANLYRYYQETGVEALLIISLTRSLKKSLDALVALVKSAEQNNGMARTSYSVLGNTGTGRSTSGGNLKSTMLCLNLQNLPNKIKHPLVNVYKLPALRDIIVAPAGQKLTITDLSASHSRVCAKFSKDTAILESLDLKDPHMVITATVMNTALNESFSFRDLEARGGKDDPQIAEYRSLGKTVFYLALNVGGAARLQQVFNKVYQDVDLEQCKLARKAFNDTFPELVQYQRELHKRSGKNIIKIPVQLKAGNRFNAQYSQFRTQDGRLIHLEAFTETKEDKNGKKYTVTRPRISDCTSAMLISGEAYAEKRSLVRIMEQIMLGKYAETNKLIGFTHDEVNCLITDDADGDAFLEMVYKINSEEFTDAVAPINSNMFGDHKSAMKCKVDRYSEK
jgi:hypothetical protein